VVSVSLREAPLLAEPVTADAEEAPRGLDIRKCFEKFSEREQLAEAETLYCSGCKQHLAPIKKMDIWAAPDILILHLKRFQYQPGQFFVHREKIEDVVDFPTEGLDLSDIVKGKFEQNVRIDVYFLFPSPYCT
jgi:ubiquitin carboxyl-terminal hydrolase 4/11